MFFPQPELCTVFVVLSLRYCVGKKQLERSLFCFSNMRAFLNTNSSRCLGFGLDNNCEFCETEGGAFKLVVLTLLTETDICLL